MRQQELKQLLENLCDKGFVRSMRNGPTGIGYTLERSIGVMENNLPIPDIGGRTEIKATRLNTNNLITLFTFNRSAWQKPQAEIVRSWGYIDESRDRPALYSTVSITAPNPQKLQIRMPKNSNDVLLVYAETDEILAKWDLYHIVGKFVTKFERLLFVHAESRQGKHGEEFHYQTAHLLSEPSTQTFRECVLAGQAFVDVRMHLKENGSVRNHGTGFRVHEHDLPALFGKRNRLM